MTWLSHFQYECPKVNKEVNYTKLKEEDEMLLITQIHEAKMSDVWFLDSSCSNSLVGK